MIEIQKCVVEQYYLPAWCGSSGFVTFKPFLKSLSYNFRSGAIAIKSDRFFKEEFDWGRPIEKIG